jgi:carotenoid cleavage dioxygenase-like enzyme
MSAAISPTRSIEALAPFRRSPEIQTGAPANVRGTIPDWLRGEVVRTCPAVFETKGWRAQHWFDGLGMIYALRARRDDHDSSPALRLRARQGGERCNRIRRQRCDFDLRARTNAFERPDATVLDLLAYPNADIMAALRTDRMTAELPELKPSLVRIVMRPGAERATVEKLSDVGFEFPSTHYKRVSGHPYRFAYGASNGYRAEGVYGSAIVKVDIETGASTSFGDDTYIFGEPLFVARPQGSAEDDGVLLSVGSSKDSETSVLAVIDAKTMALLASADVASWIPLGFHGSFVRQAGL